MRVFQCTVGNRSYPPDTGGYQRTHGLTSSFPECGDSVYRYCCTGPLSTYYAEREFINREIHFDTDIVEKRHYSVLHDLPKPLPLVGYPPFLWPAVFRTWAGKKILNEASTSDLIIADNPYLTVFLSQNSDLPTVYSSHNVEFERYLSTSDSRFSEFFGEHLQKVEKKAVKCADAIVCTTEESKDTFEKYTDSIVVIPNGISEDRVMSNVDPMDRTNLGIPADATIVTFLGSSYGPNIEAAEWLIKKWPLLDDSYYLVILGSVGEKVDCSGENICTTGYVEDLQTALSMADVALNPVISGGGSNIKLIEYFAASLPVISTPFGARGFDVEDNHDIILKEKNEFMDAITEIGQDETVRKDLGKNGNQLAAEKYTWESLSRQFRKRLTEMGVVSTAKKINS